MAKAKELLDAVITAKSIHDGDYSSLRGKSFLVCGNIENNQGRNRHVKKSNEERMTLTKLANEMRAGFKQVNSRIDNIDARLDYIVKANNLKDSPKKTN